ncbi:helix-turn-helix transcriptional regulator [Nannocystis pusilla]|uniref:helix-turn-helix transcriptional regulator n=1 Tax=Nannocystis pusilla TaxID=889268 RepID=UPI003B77CE37
MVAATPLVRELIGMLAEPGGSKRARARRAAAARAAATARDHPGRSRHADRSAGPSGRRRAARRPRRRAPLAQLGRAAGASARTLARLFLAETGASFGQWRTHLRLRAALGHLAAGTPVAVVAEQVGYAGASAFVAAFRRHLGVAPGRTSPAAEMSLGTCLPALVE